MAVVSLKSRIVAVYEFMGYRPCAKVGIFLALIVSVSTAFAQVPLEQNPLVPPALDRANIPLVPGLLDGSDPIVKNREVAVALGKAFFWDRAIGSDGLACASCHFHAGADARVTNQVNPGTTKGGTRFDSTKSGSTASGPNYTLKKTDFPFVEFVHPDDRRFGIKFPSPGEPPRDDVVSSSGAYASSYIRGSSRFRHLDECNASAQGPFKIGKIATRQVEPRNTPTVINAAFFFRTFWDGRANNIFNGRNPFGPRDPSAKIWVTRSSGQPASAEVLHLPNSSLASQASGPPSSEVEMSCSGRSFADIGRKVLPQTALATQWVHPNDSALGFLSSATSGQPGLRSSYKDLIKEAFADRYWNGYGEFGAPLVGAGQRPGRPYDHMEANFSFFFGLAIQLYESTLISDDAPFDRWRKGDVNALSPDAQRGLSLFVGKGQCINCHAGPEFSHAASHLFTVLNRGAAIERMVMISRRPMLYDSGFYNLGITPSDYDIGAGAEDPFGNPLSFSVQWSRFLRFGIFPLDHFTVDIRTFGAKAPIGAPTLDTYRFDSAAMKGAFKVPTLRNVELTGPYMHNGSMSTLEHVLEFYNRGGNFDNAEKAPDLIPLGLNDREKMHLISFLRSLTDDRVKWERAPFDHPELVIPNGHVGNAQTVVGRSMGANRVAKDKVIWLSAVGGEGRANDPLRPFHEYLSE